MERRLSGRTGIIVPPPTVRNRPISDSPDAAAGSPHDHGRALRTGPEVGRSCQREAVGRTDPIASPPAGDEPGTDSPKVRWGPRQRAPIVDPYLTESAV